MLPGGFGPSLSDPRSHASDPPMCRATEPSYWPEMRACLIAYSCFRLWEGEWVACQDQRSLEVRQRCTLGWDRVVPHLVWAQVWELLMGHYLVHSFLPYGTQRTSLVLLVHPPGFCDSRSDLSTQSRIRLNGSDVCINDGLDNLVVWEVRQS